MHSLEQSTDAAAETSLAFATLTVTPALSTQSVNPPNSLLSELRTQLSSLITQF